MNKSIKNILCYSHDNFDNIMRKNGWTTLDQLPENVACISICSENEEGVHWFKENTNKVFNLDIDDCGPFWFGRYDNDIYDESLYLFKGNKVKQSNAYFNFLQINDNQFDMIHVLDYEEAYDLINWIDMILQHVDTVYIHCAAGISRSQGVVRYILDTYGYDYDIKTNPNNPCIAPNAHVVMMLKRAYREFTNNLMDPEYFEEVKVTKEDVDNLYKHVKLNMI